MEFIEGLGQRPHHQKYTYVVRSSAVREHATLPSTSLYHLRSQSLVGDVTTSVAATPPYPPIDPLSSWSESPSAVVNSR